MLIAQISDTHIKAQGELAYERVDTKKALILCIEHINNLIPRPDITIISGDLTDSGTIEETLIFKDLIQNLEIPYYIIPGNHDNQEVIREVFTDVSYFEDKHHLHFFLDLPLKIIALDSTCKNKSYGTLCEDRLTWLEKKLQRCENQKSIIFMHHPPINVGITHMDKQNLRLGSKELGDLLLKYPNVISVACGHMHRASYTLWNNTLISTAPSSSHQVVLDLQKESKEEFIMETPAIHLHYWNDNQLTTHISYIGNFDGPYPFYDDKGNII